MKEAWKMRAEFHADLIQRWLDGKCEFWALESVMRMR